MRKDLMANIVTIDCKDIKDWASFHEVFYQTFGFPGYYGRNMDAWVDCMSCLDDPESGLCSVSVRPGGIFTLVLKDVESFKARLPEIYNALLDCTAFVNWRRSDRNESAILALAYYK